MVIPYEKFRRLADPNQLAKADTKYVADGCLTDDLSEFSGRGPAVNQKINPPPPGLPELKNPVTITKESAVIPNSWMDQWIGI